MWALGLGCSSNFASLLPKSSYLYRATPAAALLLVVAWKRRRRCVFFGNFYTSPFPITLTGAACAGTDSGCHFEIAWSVPNTITGSYALL
eukprot:2368735-Pleurochrysis_carterae.AAC.1